VVPLVVFGIDELADRWNFKEFSFWPNPRAMPHACVAGAQEADSPSALAGYPPRIEIQHRCAPAHSAVPQVDLSPTPFRVVLDNVLCDADLSRVVNYTSPRPRR
jgi:hypothetical protein